MHYFKVEFLWLFIAVTALESDVGFDLRNSGRLETFQFGMKPADKKCHNFCSLMSELCRNGGSCVMNDDTCIASCVCAPGWSGRWCRDEVSMITPGPRSELMNDSNQTATVVPRPSLGSVDLTDLRNGVKDNDDRVSNITGMASNIRANGTKPFEIRTEKIIEPESAINDFDELREDSKFNTAKNIDAGSAKQTSNDVSKCLNSCTDGDCIAKDGQYICTRRIDVSKLKGPKECQPGFVCKYGVCDMDARDKGLKCLCEPNYIGTFCEMKCPFDCGDHGVCDYHVDDNELKCFCQWNYTGLNCTELIPLPPGRLACLIILSMKLYGADQS